MNAFPQDSARCPGGKDILCSQSCHRQRDLTISSHTRSFLIWIWSSFLSSSPVNSPHDNGAIITTDCSGEVAISIFHIFLSEHMEVPPNYTTLNGGSA